jgi:membrane-associated phospholipid phosphatase
VVLSTLAILFIDRAASTWANSHLHGIVIFKWITWMIQPFPGLTAASLAVAALAGARGWKPGDAGKTWIACGVATAFAIVTKDELKLFFGRTWPESWVPDAPSWIGSHTYGFFLMHGGSGWFSFPSGHMTVITAPMAVLWRRVPRLRWIWGSLIALMALGLWGSDYHFVGDMIAGTFLGAGCAAGTLVLLDRVAPRPL